MPHMSLTDIATNTRKSLQGCVTKGLFGWPEAVRRWSESRCPLTPTEAEQVVAIIARQIEAQSKAKAQLIEPEPRTLGPKPRSRKSRRIIKGEFPGTHCHD